MVGKGELWGKNRLRTRKYQRFEEDSEGGGGALRALHNCRSLKNRYPLTMDAIKIFYRPTGGRAMSGAPLSVAITSLSRRCYESMRVCG
jgi:hypothetical protein